MEVLIQIEDHDKKVHKKRMIKLSNEATVGSLMTKLEEIFIVKRDYQEIFRGELEIHANSSYSLLSEIGVKNEDTLIFKHLMLDRWVPFKKGIENIAKLNKEKKFHFIKKFVGEELETINQLRKASFFNLYPKFDDETHSFETEFADYMDTERKYIELAAELYFLQYYGNNPNEPEFEVKFEDKAKPGAQGGLICYVYGKGDWVKKYHIKSHVGASSTPIYHSKVNLCELFVYQLLMIMKVGPNVHFIRNNHYSTYGLYIATEDVPGFKRTTAENRNEKLKLELLENILYLTDLHYANYGLDKNEHLCIVDFQVDPRKKKDLSAKNIKKIEEDIEQWNLRTSLRKAYQDINDQKGLIGSRNIERTGTNDYDKYFNQIKENIEHVLKIVEGVPEKKAKT